MPLSILVIMDSLSAIMPAKDTTFAMMLAIQQRGHCLFYCELDDVYVLNGEARAACKAIAVFDRSQNWFESKTAEDSSLLAFDIILMRKDPPVDEEYVYVTHALQLAERGGVLVANRPESLLAVNEKAFTMHFKEWTPPTLITRQRARLRAFLETEQDVVLKPLNAMGGQSIFRVTVHDVNVNALLDVITHYGTKRIIAQRFIPEIVDGDKRIILVNGEPMAYALNRIPSAKDWRGNLAAGARGVVSDVTERERLVALALTAELKRRGLYFVGLDFIGGYLTEINVTSPTGVREIKQQSGLDIADHYIAFLEEKKKSLTVGCAEV